jgi:hypothetical protein
MERATAYKKVSLSVRSEQITGTRMIIGVREIS